MTRPRRDTLIVAAAVALLLWAAATSLANSAQVGSWGWHQTSPVGMLGTHAPLGQ